MDGRWKFFSESIPIIDATSDAELLCLFIYQAHVAPISVLL